MKNILITLFLFFMLSTALLAQSLVGKRICIDPGHGGTADTDFYRVGNAGEREEWINLRVAKYLGDFLEKAGATVVLTRDSDFFVPLEERAKIAKDFKVDLFISIHHNATADTSANFPIIYYHGSAKENRASVNFAKELTRQLLSSMYHNRTQCYSIVSDYVIFPSRGASVLRNIYGIPAVIGEASFFTNPQEELRLKNDEYNKKEAEAYFTAVKFFFENKNEVLKKGSIVGSIIDIEVNQESARMNGDALNWLANIKQAQTLIESKDTKAYQRAELLLLNVLKSFPDNCRLKDLYSLLLQVYKKQGKLNQLKELKKRFENYVVII